MFSVNLLIFVSIIKISNSACNNGDGCSNDATCDVEFVDEAVYGCGGRFGSSDDRGIELGEYLCGSGYSICSTADQATNLGLTYDDCTSTTLMEENNFYVTLQSSSGSLTCDSSGTDDLFGCANTNSDSSLVYFGDFIDCGPYGAQMSTYSGNAWMYGWEPWGNGDDGELTGTYHTYTKENDAYTNITMGGVLCCANNDSEFVSTMMYSTTDDSDKYCDGCSMNATCDVEFSDYVYGCGGSWEDPGIQNGAYLCGDGYQICYDGYNAMELGLTQENCLSLPDDNFFYASAAPSLGDLECQTGLNNTLNETWGYNDVFGCGGMSTDNWICTTNNSCGSIDCGAFTSQISWNSGKGWDYGWHLWDANDTFELGAIYHFKSDYGGVLCCAESMPSSTSDVVIEESDTPSPTTVVTGDDAMQIYHSSLIIYLGLLLIVCIY